MASSHDRLAEALAPIIIAAEQHQHLRTQALSKSQPPPAPNGHADDVLLSNHNFLPEESEGHSQLLSQQEPNPSTRLATFALSDKDFHPSPSHPPRSSATLQGFEATANMQMAATEPLSSQRRESIMNGASSQVPVSVPTSGATPASTQSTVIQGFNGPFWGIHLPDVAKSVAFSEDKQLLVIGLGTGEVFFYKSPKFPLVSQKPDHIVAFHPRYAVRDLMFYDEGKYVVSSGVDHNIKVWCSDTRALLFKMTHSTQCRVIDICGDEIVVCGKHKQPTKVDKNSVYLTQIFNLKHQREISTIDSAFPACCVSLQRPHGSLLAIGMKDGRIRVVERSSERPSFFKKVSIFQAHPENKAIMRMLWLSKNILMSSSVAGDISVHDGLTGKEYQRVSCHKYSIPQFIVTQGERFLVTCSRDQTAKVFDLASGLVLMTLNGHVRAVNYVAVSAKYIFTASTDRCVRVIPNVLDASKHESETLEEGLIRLGFDASIVAYAMTEESNHDFRHLACTCAVRLHRIQLLGPVCAMSQVLGLPQAEKRNIDDFGPQSLDVVGSERVADTLHDGPEVKKPRARARGHGRARGRGASSWMPSYPGTAAYVPTRMYPVPPTHPGHIPMYSTSKPYTQDPYKLSSRISAQAPTAPSILPDAAPEIRRCPCYLRVCRMSVQEVSTWLVKEHFAFLADSFRKQHVDGELLVMLNKESLADLGLVRAIHLQRFFVARKRLLNHFFT